MADTEPTKTTKRRLKAPSQTVRQQAEKAQATADKPQRRPIRNAAKKAGKPFGSLRKAFDRQPFTFMAKIGRFIGRVLVPRFIRNAFAELKLVTWPNARKTRDLTFAVLLFAIVFGVSVAALDWGLDKLFREVLLK